MGILGFQALRLALLWSWEGKPQRLKPHSIWATFGTSEDVPFPKEAASSLRSAQTREGHEFHSCRTSLWEFSAFRRCGWLCCGVGGRQTSAAEAAVYTSSFRHV